MHSCLSRPTHLLRRSLITCIDEVLLRPFNCSAYIAFPIFFLFFFGWRYYDGCSTIPLESVDILSGKRQIDEEEEQYLAAQSAKGPKSQWRRLWDAL